MRRGRPERGRKQGRHEPKRGEARKRARDDRQPRAKRDPRDERKSAHRHPPRPGAHDRRGPQGAPQTPVIRGLDAPSFQLASQALQPIRKARAGEWLWTTRPFSERDVCEELLLWRAASQPQLVAPSLVASQGAPRTEDGLPRLAFARQGFVVSAAIERSERDQLLQALAEALSTALASAAQYALHVWVPDADASNPLASDAAALRAALEAALSARLPAAERVTATANMPQDLPIAQVCLASATLAYAGVLPLGHALSLAPGGRERMRVQGDRPSRSARKLEEALAWAGIAPGPGEQCIDLGAAPGGWTWIARKRGCRVIAVDPAALRPDIASDRGVRHIQRSAFDFEPEEPADFLLCDMAWRPLEVAAMLARYARTRMARFLIANFKLPMKRKAETVARICEVLQAGGFRGVRVRQLYHDRDEVTVFARA